MLYAKQFDNPFLIEYYVGVRGSGKSTLATKEAISFRRMVLKFTVILKCSVLIM